MFDLKIIRDDPSAFDVAMKRRGLDAVTPQILVLDEKKRALLTRAQDGLARRNEASKLIGQAMQAGDKAKADELKAQVSALKDEIVGLELEEKQISEKLEALLLALPNNVHSDIPDGLSEDDNVEIHRYGTPRAFDFTPLEHFTLGENLGLMDFERASKLSGARFVTLKGALARLERALGQFMLDSHTQNFGYEEMAVPVLTLPDCLVGTGQLPKFEEDLFKAGDKHYLIPTAEVVLTNFHREEILEEENLPKRLTALTPCFRAEAGSAGRDTRGMIRQHQFMKVELVSLVTPEQAASEHARMLEAAEAILKALELPYRVITLCTGDIGFSAKRTYDIEVWLPGQGRYREISSCSDCGDFQTRRMNLRGRAKGDKKTRFLHSLNGSGLAVGRALIAVMENYQEADGRIKIPEALRPYMGGLAWIEA